MPKRSLFNQFNQMRGTRDFEDLSAYNELAELVGRSYLTGTLSITSGSATVVDSSNTFNKDEQNNFIVVTDGPAAGVYTIVSGVGNTADVTPVPTATDATASYRRHYYQNLEDDLNYLRTMMQMIIGENNWYDDPNTDLRNMAYLIPATPNRVGDNTAYPGIRSGVVSFSVSNIDQQGYVSTGAPADEYTAAGSSSVSAGTQLYFTDDSTMVVSIPGGFYPADLGTISIISDSQIIGTLDLAAAWTNDGCVYESSESDVGTNPVHTSTHTGTDIIDLSNRRCMNTTVDSFPNFWPSYQIASMTATVTLPAGFQGQISVTHSTGGGQNYTYGSFWVDTTSQTISTAAPVFTLNSAATRYLSGVPYYTTGTVFNYSISNSDTLFDRGYLTNPLTINLAQFNASSQTPTLAALGIATPATITDTIATYSGTVTVGTGNFRDLDARATATFRNVFTSATSGDSAAGTFRIDTYGQTATDTQENFDDEVYRFRGTEDFTDITIDEVDSVWASTDNITAVGGGAEDGLVVYNGTLKYPTINHSSGFLPVGPDYSGQSGDFVYYRVFLATAAFTNGTITFSGWSNALSVIQGADVEVHLRYPNCSNYGNGNDGDVWQNLSVDQTIYGGDGCLGTDSSGSTVAFSFGTTSSVSYGNRVIMRIKFKTSSVTALTGITFNPTL